MPVVMGTAGHIDHGKTSLIKALTLTNCDRLLEEQKRGITIELGFAFLDLPAGQRLSIIDVPGHERFVHTMMAGATGIDFVLLVIAADEGIMPQTREHLEICTLLGIKHGLVALTKIDMVDDELLELAKDDISSHLKGSFLESAPILPVSAHSGEGLAELIAAMENMEKTLAPRKRPDLLRLPVDRIFTVKGHGTVVTGTMISGKTAVGDEVCVYPANKKAKVRSLQSHNEQSELGLAGKRTALNLQGLGVDDIHKGDVVGHPGNLFPSYSWCCELSCLASSPKALRHRTEVHLHHGSKSTLTRILLPEGSTLEPGQSSIVELIFSEPMTGVFGDHFVIRSFSPLQTVAGGRIIYPMELRLKKRQAGYVQKIETLGASATYLHDKDKAIWSDKETIAADEALLARILLLAGEKGSSFAELCISSNLDQKSLEKHLASLGSKQAAICTDREIRLYHSAHILENLGNNILNYLQEHHQKNPMRQGASKGELASAYPKPLSPKLLHTIIERLQKQGKILCTKELFHLPEHKPTLGAENSETSLAIVNAHVKAGITPPNMKDVLEELKLDEKQVAPLLKHLQDSGVLVKVADGLWYASEALEQIKKQILIWYESNESLDLAGLKSITNLSRKYLVALLEYFDKEKLTVRVGDKRLLRK